MNLTFKLKQKYKNDSIYNATIYLGNILIGKYHFETIEDLKETLNWHYYLSDDQLKILISNLVFSLNDIKISYSYNGYVIWLLAGNNDISIDFSAIKMINKKYRLLDLEDYKMPYNSIEEINDFLKYNFNIKIRNKTIEKFNADRLIEAFET